jgi:hypothetical protein
VKRQGEGEGDAHRQGDPAQEGGEAGPEEKGGEVKRKRMRKERERMKKRRKTEEERGKERKKTTGSFSPSAFILHYSSLQ